MIRFKPLLHLAKHRIPGVLTRLIRHACRYSGEQLDPLFDTVDFIDMEPVFLYGLKDILP